MNEEIQDLINLLYNNNISQSGKRKLEKYIKEMEKEIEYKEIDFLTAYMQGYFDGKKRMKNKMKDKIKEKIKELKNRKIGASTGIFAVQVDILEELLEE